eukprot:gene3464-3960_t
MELNEKTNDLLKKKGLRCICELCDCGKHHKHRGCKKILPIVNATSKFSDRKTDYQESYKNKGSLQMTQSVKPLPIALNPDPPIMDFRTTNRLHFKKENVVERTKPCKLTSEYEGLTGPFNGSSVYKVDFPGHNPSPIKIERPKTQKVEREVKLDDRTMYMNAFQPKEKGKPDAFQELPSFAYSILYPDRNNPIDKISFKNEIHAGKFVARPDALAPKGGAIKIGIEGSYDHMTTHNDTFKQYTNFKKEQPLKKDVEWKPRPKFSSKTRAQEDFQGFGVKMPERRKPITPPPETIDLRVDKNRYLETTKENELKITWEKNKLYRPPLQKAVERYTPPKDKFEGLSVMQADFQKHQPVKPTIMKPIPLHKQVDGGKFSSATSYGSQFPDYGKIQISRHGDRYEKQYYVKPINKFNEGDTVMRCDFKSHGNVKRVSPIIPENNRHAKGEQFYGETSYNREFQPKKIEPCSLTKVLFELEAKKLEDDVIKHEPRPSKLAASF